MRYNVFSFGDCVFFQLEGTAMGTPSAVQYAAISFGKIEIFFILIDKYKKNLRLYRRQTDDIAGVWVPIPYGPTRSQ